MLCIFLCLLIGCLYFMLNLEVKDPIASHCSFSIEIFIISGPIAGLPPNQELRENQEILFSIRDSEGEMRDFVKNLGKSGNF